MARIKIIVNGQKYNADSDNTILKTVHDLKIDHIPNLCFEKQLDPYNSCYLCVVEVKGQANLAPACSTKVQDKMEIFTRSSRVLEARRTALELLLSNHYADCLAPCTLKCPAGVDVQGYIALIAAGKPQEAVQLIKQTNPLPAVCGRVCTRPCELACRRNLLDDQVGIDFLKRYAADYDLDKALHHVKPICQPDKDQRVAVIGAGPAGLSAAYYLRLKGFKVKIFEAMPEAGGMLRYGIPIYRLPFDLLDREIDTILEMGVEIRTNTALGDDITIKSLLEDGYQSVFLGMGAWGSRKLGAPGQDAEGILSGIKFLEQMGRNQNPEISGKIVVVGGGNTAIDCARTSLRMNAEEVILLYRRTRKEMPANEMEIDAAEHEGVKMHFLAAPVEVLTENNRVKALKCIKMELGEPDSSGRRRPVPMSGSEFVLECDYVFAAIGQSPDLTVLTKKSEDMYPAETEPVFTRWGSIAVNEETFETDVEGVFAGGDMVSGAATAIEAIAAGRKAAHAISSFLNNGIPQAEPFHYNSRKDDFRDVTVNDLRYQKEIPAHPMPELDVKERITNFDEVELGFTMDQAMEESQRCLECGCEAVFACKLRQYATDYGIVLDKYKGEVNVYDLDQSHPLIELDPNKCILCGRCIRVCDQIVGASVYGFEDRGFQTIVRPEMGRTLLDTNCISCGMCVATCPTGAIAAKISLPKPGPWDLKEVKSVCTYCGVGCTMNVGVIDNQIVKTVADESESHNHGNLCILGRFGYGFVNDKNRILEPSVKKDGNCEKVSWKDAFRDAAQKIKSITQRYQPNEIAVFISPRLTNEEIYLLQKFTRIVLGTHQISSFTTPDHRIVKQEIQSTAVLSDLETADAVLITMAHMRRDHPVVDFAIRKAQKKGANVVYIGSEHDQMLDKWDACLTVKSGTEYVAILGLMKAKFETGEYGNISADGLDMFMEKIKNLTPDAICKVTGVTWDKYQKAAVMLSEGKKTVFSADRNYVGPRAVDDIELLSAAAHIFNADTAFFTEQNNTQGLMDLGGMGSWYPGYQSIHDEKVVQKFEKRWCVDLSGIPAPRKDLVTVLKNKELKAVVIFGEDVAGIEAGSSELIEALKSVEILIVSDLFKTETTELAGIVIPMSSSVETDGSFTSGLRTVSELRQAIKPLAGMELWKIITSLARELGLRYKFNYRSVAEIQEEIRSLAPSHKDIVFGENGHTQIWNLEQVEEVNNQTAFKENWITLEPDKVHNPSGLGTNSIHRWADHFRGEIGLK
jgi:formate dehydrogenase major subunit